MQLPLPSAMFNRAQMEANQQMMLQQIAQQAAAYQQMAAPRQAPQKRAPVTYKGMWDMGAGKPLQLWNLTEDIPGHPKGSTLTGDTLMKYGYSVPEVNPQMDLFKPSNP